MGTAVSGDTELIRVTLVDYFTEEILVDNIVEPGVPMQHLNTKYSGVSWADVNKARREGTILDGKGGARQAIWQFVGSDTFVIGHGASNDLRSLRWIHLRVVDSMVTEFVHTKAKEAKEAEEMKLKLAKEVEELVLTQAEEAVLRQKMMAAIAEHDAGATKTVLDASGTKTVLDAATVPPAAEEKAPAPKPKNLSLKTMTKKYLDRDIQTKGKAGHDSLEDAIAARDLVHRSVCEVMRG
jgi:RNA exonuclease 1